MEPEGEDARPSPRAASPPHYPLKVICTPITHGPVRPAQSAGQPAPAGNQHLFTPEPPAGACLSRAHRGGARTVLRGRRPGNRPPLPGGMPAATGLAVASPGDQRLRDPGVRHEGPGRMPDPRGHYRACPGQADARPASSDRGQASLALAWRAAFRSDAAGTSRPATCPGGASRRVRGRARTPVPLAHSGRRPRSLPPTPGQPPGWARRRR